MTLKPEDFKVGAVIEHQYDGESYSYKLVNHEADMDGWNAIFLLPERLKNQKAFLLTYLTTNNPHFFLARKKEIRWTT